MRWLGRGKEGGGWLDGGEMVVRGLGEGSERMR